MVVLGEVGGVGRWVGKGNQGFTHLMPSLTGIPGGRITGGGVNATSCKGLL